MQLLTFSVEEAKNFSEQGRMEEWVHIFLKTVGENKEFSNGLKLERRYWLGPILISLNEINRCCGPEGNMEYQVPNTEWENQIKKFCEMLEKGWECPPLIVQHQSGKLIINDGNHRYEAMKRLGFKECWVILWDTKTPEHINKYVDDSYCRKKV